MSPKKKSKSGIDPQRTRRPSEQSGTKSPAKTRTRRASSLDRETKSKTSKSKVKQSFHSDNELEADSVKADGAGNHNNADESTDDEYFQNEFKNFLRKGDDSKRAAPIGKKRKGFLFKQKYIFQRKRKANKGRGKSLHLQEGGQLDEIYSFHEEVSNS